VIHGKGTAPEAAQGTVKSATTCIQRGLYFTVPGTRHAVQMCAEFNAGKGGNQRVEDGVYIFFFCAANGIAQRNDFKPGITSCAE
jgi:hypothetical protein